MSWVALFVETGKEDAVKKLTKLFFAYKSQPIKCLVPKKIVSEKKNGIVYEVQKVLIPGYIFIQTDFSPKIYYLLRSIPNVFYVVKSGNFKWDQSNNFFSEIPIDEMNWILNLTNELGIIEYSDVVLLPNHQVKVIAGPLLGKESIIRKVNVRKRRAKIKVTLLGEQKLLDVGVNFIE